MSRSYFGHGVDSKKPQGRTYRDVDSLWKRNRAKAGQIQDLSRSPAKDTSTVRTPHHEDIMDIMAEMSRAGTFQEGVCDDA